MLTSLHSATTRRDFRLWAHGVIAAMQKSVYVRHSCCPRVQSPFLFLAYSLTHSRIHSFTYSLTHLSLLVGRRPQGVEDCLQRRTICVRLAVVGQRHSARAVNQDVAAHLIYVLPL